MRGASVEGNYVSSYNRDTRLTVIEVSIVVRFQEEEAENVVFGDRLDHVFFFVIIDVDGRGGVQFCGRDEGFFEAPKTEGLRSDREHK